MSTGLRSVWPLFVGVLLLQLGHGLQGSLVSLEASALQFSSLTTGLVMAGFYIGLYLSSILSPAIIGTVGHIRAFAAFASLVSTAILLMPLWHDPFWWFAMRIIVGVCIAGLSIVSESWLNASSSNQERGKMLAIYMIIAYGANGMGQFLLNVSDSSGFARFIVVSALLSIALVPISLARVQAPVIETPKPVGLKDVFRLSPLAFVGTFAAGLGQSAFFTMAPIYGLDKGLSLVQISTMMALPSLGVILSQYPVGSLSDRFDRRIVITIMTFLSLMVAVAALIASNGSATTIIGLLAVFGAVSFPIYSLAMAHANDYLDTDQMLGASAKLVLIYGMGAIVGPIIVGGVMQELGADGFMIYLAVTHGGLGVYALLRMLLRPDTPDDTGEYIPVAPQSTPIVAQVVAEEYDYDAESEEAKESSN